VVNTRKNRAARGKAKPRAGAPDPAALRTVYTLSEQETFDLGRALARNLKGGELILLEGELGMGKTVFARGIAVGLGVRPEDVSSPSFTLVQEYTGGRLPIFHVDLYRLETAEETESLGLEEILTAGGVVVVEWGDRLAAYYRRDAMTIRFHDVGEGSRRLEIHPRPVTPPTRRGDA